MASISIRPGSWPSIALAAILLWQPARAEDGTVPNRLTDESLDCLAANVYHEARGEPIIGQFAVAWVTLNRVASRKWPNTVCGVVYQPWQFSWTNDPLSDEMTHERSVLISQMVAKYAQLPTWTLEATHYHAEHIYPYWAPTLKREVQIGNHIFYY